MFSYLNLVKMGESARWEDCLCGKRFCGGKAAPVCGWQSLCILEPGQTAGRSKASFHLLFGHRVFCSPRPTHSWVSDSISQSNSKGFANSGRFSQTSVVNCQF